MAKSRKAASWWEKRSNEQKFFMIASGLTLTALGFVALASRDGKASPKTNVSTGLEPANSECSAWNITNQQLVGAKLNEAISANPGTPDVEGIARAWISDVASKCEPMSPRNPGEATLYYRALNTVAATLRARGAIDNQQAEIANQQAQLWAVQNGLTPADLEQFKINNHTLLIMPPPADQNVCGPGMIQVELENGAIVCGTLPAGA